MEGSPARQARGHERVELILRATLVVFARSGVPSVTHRSVAEEAGVPLGSLTYYFASKQELLREALHLHVSEDAGRLRALAAQLSSSGAPPQTIVDAFADLLAVDHGDIAQFELYLEAARDPQLRDTATESLQAYAEVAELALRAAGVADPAETAALIVATIDGISLHRRASGDASAPELHAALGRLLRALLVPAATLDPAD
jgi:TetR/AcrR family transcriptional regulator, regulator of biofilm formation and stress response